MSEVGPTDPTTSDGPPPPAPPPPPTSLARRAAASVGFVGLVVAVELLRQPGARTWDTVWAEDGTIYAEQAIHLPALTALTRPYAGYVQLLPRLLALPARVLPVAWYAPWFAVAGALTAALLGLLVVHSAEGWITNRGLRWLVGLTVATTPTVAYELNANVVNLNWLLLATSFWVIASRRRGAAETTLRACVLALAALSTPLTAVMVPFAVVVTVRRRRRPDLVVLGALLGGLALQAAIAVGAVRAPASGRDYGHATEGFFVRVVGSLVLGERWLSDLFPVHTHLVIFGSVAVVVAIAALARADRLRGDRAWFVGSAVFTAVLVYAVAAVARGTDWMPFAAPDGSFTNAGSRYEYVPIFLLTSAIVVLVDRSRLDWLKALVAAWVLVVLVSSWGPTSSRSAGPDWSAAVRQAQADCRAHPDQAEALLPITPFTWRVAIPCSRLRDPDRWFDRRATGQRTDAPAGAPTTAPATPPDALVGRWNGPWPVGGYGTMTRTGPSGR